MRRLMLIALLAQLSANPLAAQGLDGTWVGNVTCNNQYWEPQPWPLTINITGRTLTLTTPNTSGTGTITGKFVSWKMSNLLNVVHGSGTVSGNRMSGTYIQPLTGAPCSWVATRGGRPHD
jgi:hypothetical protein